MVGVWNSGTVKSLEMVTVSSSSMSSTYWSSNVRDPISIFSSCVSNGIFLGSNLENRVATKFSLYNTVPSLKLTILILSGVLGANPFLNLISGVQILAYSSNITAASSLVKLYFPIDSSNLSLGSHQTKLKEPLAS